MFDGKKIILTGGSSGVGKKLAQRLIKNGAHLALVARDEKKLSAVKKELLASVPDRNIEIYPCDVADSKAVEQTFKRITDKSGTLDILINSAGILREGYFENQSLETF